MQVGVSGKVIGDIGPQFRLDSKKSAGAPHWDQTLARPRMLRFLSSGSKIPARGPAGQTLNAADIPPIHEWIREGAHLGRAPSFALAPALIFFCAPIGTGVCARNTAPLKSDA